MPHTYIVECSDGSYYVGSTWDLERRIGEHNLGLGAEYTRRRRPVRLVWAAQFDRIEDAYRLEKQVQNWGRAKRQALIDGRFDDLPRLARTAKRRRPTGVVSTSSTDEPRDGTDNHLVVSTSSTDDSVVSTSSTDDTSSTHDTSSTDEQPGSTDAR